MTKSTQKPKPATEADIRDRLINFFHQRHRSRKQLFVPEMDIGGTRVDLAILSRGSHALVEIKSGNDTLSRLEKQITWYELHGDELWLVVHPKHVDKLPELPLYWGLIVAANTSDRILLKVVKEPGGNPMDDQARLLRQCGYLWRKEVQCALKAAGVKKAYTYARWKGCRLLASKWPQKVKPAVFEHLVARGDWREVHHQEQRRDDERELRRLKAGNGPDHQIEFLEKKLERSLDSVRRTKIQLR